MNEDARSRMMVQMSSNLVVVITGTNSGLGLALAKEFHNADYTVIATARPSNILYHPLNSQQHNNVHIRPLDLISPESIEGLSKSIIEEFGRVDVLINNAGISFRSAVEQMNRDEEALQMQTNYFGPMTLIRSLLPYMREHGQGKIINISSVAGMMAMPTMGSYSASKFALEGASEALWYEL
ncbi:MAG: SDR family NAD(P)-dependent oxidoreductase, partial [Bdellovibrionales bacterium]|nr:SDR family NAD(P)-dependent oxidoreductase [Bdellovibrionales bacterium]